MINNVTCPSCTHKKKQNRFNRSFPSPFLYVADVKNDMNKFPMLFWLLLVHFPFFSSSQKTIVKNFLLMFGGNKTIAKGGKEREPQNLETTLVVIFKIIHKSPIDIARVESRMRVEIVAQQGRPGMRVDFVASKAVLGPDGELLTRERRQEIVQPLGLLLRVDATSDPGLPGHGGDERTRGVRGGKRRVGQGRVGQGLESRRLRQVHLVTRRRRDGELGRRRAVGVVGPRHLLSIQHGLHAFPDDGVASLQGRHGVGRLLQHVQQETQPVSLCGRRLVLSRLTFSLEP